MNKLLVTIFVLMLAGCSLWSQEEVDGCPKISIPQDADRVFQSNGVSDTFQINLIGYESFCFTHSSNNRRYAVITPLFKVRRLQADDTTSLDIKFYVKTSINAEDYLGVKEFYQVLNIPQSSKEEIIKGRRTLTRIPKLPYGDFDIRLGLVLTSAEKAKARSMYDIYYKYLNEEELLPSGEIKTENIYIEASDDEVFYGGSKSFFIKEPTPLQNSCSTCSKCQ